MIMIAAGVLHHVTCYDYRFVQSMVCICDVWEEYDERSEGASTVSTHESRGIEKGKEQEWRRYRQRKMRQ